jgi:uncharacterized 2Fe-2S/4Fe-4S cluster protein (DUF4445 family)
MKKISTDINAGSNEMVRIKFLPDNREVIVTKGTSILAAARQAGIVIEAPCNGAGHCLKCGVRVAHDDLEKIIQNVEPLLTPEELASGIVLSCHATAREDVTIHVIENTETGLKIITGGLRGRVNIEPFVYKVYHELLKRTAVFGGDEILTSEEGDTTARHYGAVVDIGTTTLVVCLVDLKSGEELISLSVLNPQSLHGQDVLSRIKFAGDQGGLNVLHGVLVNELNRLIAEAANSAGISRSDIYEVIFSGNTCMLHLAIGVDPSPLGKYPYTPAITGGNHLDAVAYGIAVAEQGLIYLPPIVSSYVGADITAGIAAAQLGTLSGTTLFIDIGTNGEMVLARDGKLAATSTAAGPAFEGMNINCGMRAADGAIEYFSIERDGSIEIETIGSVLPVGICGSGLIDIVGELAANGIITASGRFIKPGSPDIHPLLSERLIKKEGEVVFLLAGNVYLSQKDVRQVQLAKGAIRAGIEFLLQQKDVAVGEVDRVLIAGSFGYHLREKSLLNLGLLPAEFRGKVNFVGNTSKSGGEMLLLNRSLRKEITELVKDVEIVDLTACKDFDRVFIETMKFEGAVHV